MPTNTKELERLLALANRRLNASTEETVEMWRTLKSLANDLLVGAGFSDKSVKAMHTKFNDAGRRSAPWKAFSSKVPGRPQDGSDGNRINRWLLPKKHKFYATEKDATLVQIRYYLQMLSMEGAPCLPDKRLEPAFVWLAGHDIRAGLYEDPIQLIPISLKAFLDNPRGITSGHLIPLDRNGRHVPDNAFLMLHRSNQLQGNMTLEELLELMTKILKRHQKRGVKGRHVG